MIDDQEWEIEDRSEPERLVINCGYPGCCMPGAHFPSECHNAEDMENLMRCEAVGSPNSRDEEPGKKA
jgi:hypothetical protein